MRFFRKSPAPGPAPRRVHHPWNPPETEFPGIVAMDTLQSRGGGTSHSQLFQWWVWPLPPAGPLEFICQWPVYGIGETRVGIDGQVILDAARRSVQLWPEDG